MISQLLKWTGIVLGGLVLAVVLFLAFFDLNRLRGPLSTMVSDKLERSFAIRGDLDVDWSWTSKITINELELGNASWGSRPEMFTLDRAEVSLRIPDLFKGQLVLPEIRVSKPHLLLEKNAEGKANWDFGLPPKEEEKKPTGPPISLRWFPQIDRLAIDDGKLVFRDPTSHTELDMNVSNVVGASNEEALELTSRGRLQKEQFTLDVRGGSILTLWQTDKPFPVNIKVAYGDTEAKVSGTIAEPCNLKAPTFAWKPMGRTWPCCAPSPVSGYPRPRPTSSPGTLAARASAGE